MIFIKMMAIICYLEDEASCDNVTHCTLFGSLLSNFVSLLHEQLSPMVSVVDPNGTFCYKCVSMVDIGTIDHVISRLVRA